MESYDSIFAAREECLAEVDAVVATIEALQASSVVNWLHSMSRRRSGS
jgi:hypothetical protein